jgi:nucleotide-binding universal stress UspA family protein
MSVINSIQIIGTGNKMYLLWKEKIENMLKSINTNIELEEVQDIDKILTYNLENIPAIAFDGKVVLQRNNFTPSADELEKVLNNYILKSGKMNTILVPTDFSANAKGAFKYAQKLADQLNANIKVIHIHNPASDGIIPNEIGSATLMESAKQEMLDRFINIGDGSVIDDVITELMVDRELIIGFAAEEIIRMSKEENIDMIVMGTKGKGGALEQMFGSVSTHVSQKAECPVWLVPEGTVYKEIKNIVYASNYELVDDQMMDEIFNLADKFGSEVTFVHVENEKEKNEVGEFVLENLFRKKLPDHNFKMTSIENSEVWAGICKYSNEHNANLITLITKHRGFIDNLFHRSVTKQVILHANCPMLILHLK